jgi:hypothetical protein
MLKVLVVFQLGWRNQDLLRLVGQLSMLLLLQGLFSKLYTLNNVITYNVFTVFLDLTRGIQKSIIKIAMFYLNMPSKLMMAKNCLLCEALMVGSHCHRCHSPVKSISFVEVSIIEESEHSLLKVPVFRSTMSRV